MEKEKKKSFLADLLGLNSANNNFNVDFKFVPFDDKLLELSWNSPNDGRKNLIQFLMKPNELDRIELEDYH